MRIIKKALFWLIIFSAYAFGVFAQESNNLIDTLNVQIEKARIAVDEKLQQETKENNGLLIKKIKEEAIKKEIQDLYNEAKKDIQGKRYLKAKEIYERLLVLNPQAKEEIKKNIDFCITNGKIFKDKQRQELEKKKQIHQRELAEGFVLGRERKHREEKEKNLVLERAQIEKHLSLGNEYLANKNYLQASEEFEAVLKIAPAHKEAISRLAKAKAFIYGVSEETPKGIKIPTQEPSRTQLIKEGFQEALKYLESNNYRNAEAEFTKILDNINQLNLENSQLKIVKEIKEYAQKGPQEVLSYIRSDKYDEAKKKLWELIQKTAVLAKEREAREIEEKNRLLIESYLKNTSGYLEKSGYKNAKVELEKVLSLDPQNQEANALLERLEDIIAITSEIK